MNENKWNLKWYMIISIIFFLFPSDFIYLIFASIRYIAECKELEFENPRAIADYYDYMFKWLQNIIKQYYVIEFYAYSTHPI